MQLFGRKMLLLFGPVIFSPFLSLRTLFSNLHTVINSSISSFVGILHSSPHWAVAASNLGLPEIFTTCFCMWQCSLNTSDYSFLNNHLSVLSRPKRNSRRILQENSLRRYKSPISIRWAILNPSLKRRSCLTYLI